MGNDGSELEALLQSYILRGHAPKLGSRLHRARIAKVIGVSESSLSRNIKLQRQIARFERDHLDALVDTRAVDAGVPSNVIDDDVVDSVSKNIILFRRPERTGRIVISTVIWEKQEYRVPTLVWETGIDTIASDWLRYVAIKLGKSDGTAEECAKIYRKYANLCDKFGVSWDKGDDDLLRLWVGEMKIDGLTPKRINKSINVVHSFYRWAEDTGRVKNHVEVVERQNLPDEIKTYKFPISSRRVERKRSHGMIEKSWRSTVFVTGETSSDGVRHTPSNDEIETIFDAALEDPINGTRNSLLLSWALDTGGRNHEILQLRLDDLPQTDDDFRRMNEIDFWPIEIKRKGKKGTRGVLRPSADLIRRTFVYIRKERAALALKVRGRQRGECNFVFLSEKGDVLTTDSVTRIVRKIFKAAGVTKANIHRLRAKFAQNMVEAALDALEEAGIAVGGTSNWHETALTMAKEMMGHTSIMSLRPYLNALLKRRVDLSPTYMANKERGAQRERELLEKQQKHSLEGHIELARIGNLIKGGKKEEAAKQLRQFAEVIEQ